MRTKLLLGAAILAAGVASTMAQSNVYSLNVVGYYNLPLVANRYYLIANQLNTTNNTIASVLSTGPAGAIFQKYNGGFAPYVFDDVDLVWTPDGNATLNPGEGGYYRSPTATTLTFVGEVLQGSLTNTLLIGNYAVRSSMVPQTGRTTTDLGLPAEGGDIEQVFNNGFTPYVFDDVDLVWTPSEPTNTLGSSFFYRKAPTGTQSKWIRNFTVQ